MKVIYIDSLFILNIVINYLLLLTTAKIVGTYYSRLRLAFGAAIGALYAVLAWLPGLGLLGSWPIKVMSGILIVFAALSGGGYILRKIFVFTGVSFALGGSIFAVSFLAFGISPPGGIPYLPIDGKTLLLSAGLSYGILTLVFKGIGRPKKTYSVQISLRERRISINALLDTGNTLTDPLTGMPVIIVEEAAARSLLGVTINEKQLKNPADALTILNKTNTGVPFRLIPYGAVGVECGLLLAFKPDCVIIDKRRHSHMLVAISPTILSDSAGFQALLGVL